MTARERLALGGFAATAVTYGPGRMGFGLFLSEFRAEFGISPGVAGLISGLGFLGFLLGLVAAHRMTFRHGPRRPVLAGLAAAAAGMALIAMAPGLPALTAGVCLAMSSAGFTWAPFNDAVHRSVADAERPRALSVVSTGTTLGVAAAAAAALALGLGGASWRIAWAAFAAAAIGAGLLNRHALRNVAAPAGRGRARLRDLLRRASAAPLFAVALSFGATTATYITFAADRIEQSGGLPGLPASASSSLVFLSYGVVGLAGLAAGRARRALGLARLLRALLAVSALSHLLVALAPTSWTGAVLSAGLQGAFVMMTSAVLAFWSERLFPSRPSLGFTAALLALAAGSVAGPVAAGVVADRAAPSAAFLAAGAVSLVTAAAILPRHVRERPAPA